MSRAFRHVVADPTVSTRWVFAADSSAEIVWHLQELRRTRWMARRAAPWPGQQRRIELCDQAIEHLNHVLSIFLDLEVLAAREQWCITDDGSVVPVAT